MSTEQRAYLVTRAATVSGIETNILSAWQNVIISVSCLVRVGLQS